MTVQEALQVYKIPFAITEHNTAAGCESFRLAPVGSSATITRLKTRLDDIIAATGQPLEVLSDCNGVYLRTIKPTLYNYMDYNGYIDYNSSDIPYLVGIGQSGIVTDTFEKARHLLIAGTTGSGKSVFMHDLIVSTLCNPHCITAMIDIKRVEFGIYKDVATVETEIPGAMSITSYFVESMLKRYEIMEKHGINNYNDLVAIAPDTKRYILIVDELSDLISDKKSRAALIPKFLRIAQLGRAAGVHIVIATQRPDSQVINGTLKANIPSRMAFQTLSAIDSRIILEQSGAERLHGSGDGLYSSNGATPERVQAPYIDLEQIKRELFRR